MKYLQLKFCILSCFFISWLTSATEIKVDIYADDSYPPYSYSENGKLKGIYTDILKKVFSKMSKYKITINPIAWKLGLSYIESGKGFALSPPYHRTKERPYIWPYSIPILDERIIVVCRANVLARTIRSLWPEDYYGLIIGLNSGFTLGGEKFWQAVEDKKITTLEAPGSEKNLMMLGNKKTDCYMNDKISTFWTLKQLKAAGKYDEGGKHEKLAEATTISIEQGFLGFTAKGGDKYPYMDDFVLQFNKEIYMIRRSGELQQIIDDFIK